MVIRDLLWRSSPRKAFERGLELAETGQFQEAFSAFAVAAQAGLPEAQYAVAQHYFDGAGVPASRVEGVVWLRMAAEAGHREAQALLASLYANGLAGSTTGTSLGAGADVEDDMPSGPDFDEAFAWACKASAQGSAKADALLAYIHLNGPDHLRDPDVSFTLYKRSAEAGCPEGALGYALQLSRRSQTDADRRELVTHLRVAADAGLGTAIYMLARLTARGAVPGAGPNEALDLYRKAAERGVPAAMFEYGTALVADGQEPAAAVMGETWLRRAAMVGHAEAAFRLGELHARGRGRATSYTEAAQWYRAAAQAGHPAAARALASLYLTGAGVEADEEMAAHWVRVAAKEGDDDSRLMIGNALLSGHDVGVDPTEVMQWFVKAASGGDPTAAFNIAVCLANGIGIERDDRRAATWMARAALEIPEAQFMFGRMLAQGRGVAADLDEARVFIAKAAAAGVPDAEVALGEMMVTGRGGPRDLAMAHQLFLRAAAKSHTGALYALGLMAYNGLDVAKDAAAGDDGGTIDENRTMDEKTRREADARGFGYVRAAAERGHADAQFLLGRAYRDGLGTPPDPAAAREWLSRAAAQGAEEAQADLAALA
jgi:TPR repeat protein